jgi:predicted RNA-binding protein with PUA-like domain
VTTLNRKVRDAGKNGTGGAKFKRLHFYAAAFLCAVINDNDMQYWLMKSEPDDVSIDDALGTRGQTVAWVGVRNYQARNFMRDAMRIGDGVLFYHSGCAQPGIAGLAEVASIAYPDDTQFDPGSKYFDPKATRENPRWMLVDVKALKKTRLITLPELRADPELADMQVLRRGNRLSITPVAPHEWRRIAQLF